MTEHMERVPETGMRWHPYAELFPWIEGEAFDQFVEDVRQRGVIEPIVMFEGQLLDGRNRYMAARKLNIKYPVTEYRGADPLGYVLSKNLHRRQLSESQRAIVATKLGKLEHGGVRSKGSIEPLSADQRADMVNVGRASVIRADAVVEKGIPELTKAVEQGEIKVSAAEKISRLPQEEQPAAIEKALPSGHRAIMGSRQEPDDSLDFFPTPPWATRALMERVFGKSGLLPAFSFKSVWEPACGEGHIAEVLEEYGVDVMSSDVHDYGYGDFTGDFLGEPQPNWPKPEWIITNPPFRDKAEKFVLRALNRSTVGVAMFFRVQWLDTIGRYERVFKDDPPTLMSFFAERVNLCQGRWDPEGSTATAYMWLVWLHGEKPRAPFWIPPGCRDALTKPGDAERFTAHPVKKSPQQFGSAA